MSRWFFSIQLRLIVVFALVLVMALGSVSLYVGLAANREADQFDERLEEARAARVEQMISRLYSERQDWGELQAIVEQAGSLYDRRIVVTDSEGRIVADSHFRFGRPWIPRQRESRFMPIVSGNEEIGSLALAPSEIQETIAEPAISRVVSSLNRSLIWTGLAAGVGGILLVSLMSRRILTPVRELTLAAGRLGQGDLSQRVATSSRDEIGQLGATFNAMAEGLEGAERQRRSLMADVAHELRTPLSNIQGYLEAVRDGLLEPDNATIDTIYQQVLHLTRLVEDLRLLALADAGALSLSLQEESLQEVLQSSVASCRPRAEAKGVSVALSIPSEIPLVQMDRTRIAQVVSNLLDNAIFHTPQGGSVSVSAESLGSAVRIIVADTGEGIPPEDLPQVFERFYRVDPSRARTTGGTGLGLTIARQLVEAHRGTIRAESTPGRGSRFIFELPLA